MRRAVQDTVRDSRRAALGAPERGASRAAVMRWLALVASAAVLAGTMCSLGAGAASATVDPNVFKDNEPDWAKPGTTEVVRISLPGNINLAGQSTASPNGTPVTVDPHTNDSSGSTETLVRTQQWQWVPEVAGQRMTDGGWGELVHRETGACLDVTGNSTASGTAVVLWGCNGGNNQKFKAVVKPNGTYMIVDKNSGLWLGKKSANSTTQIQDWGSTNSTDWTITRTAYKFATNMVAAVFAHTPSSVGFNPDDWSEYNCLPSYDFRLSSGDEPTYTNISDPGISPSSFIHSMDVRTFPEGVRHIAYVNSSSSSGTGQLYLYCNPN